MEKREKKKNREEEKKKRNDYKQRTTHSELQLVLAPHRMIKRKEKRQLLTAAVSNTVFRVPLYFRAAYVSLESLLFHFFRV